MLVVAAALGAAPVVAAHAGGQAMLTLSGNHTSYVDLTLASGVDFDLVHAAFSGRGRYQGFYAEAIDKPVSDRSAPGARVGLVSLRDYHGPGRPAEAIELDGGNRHLNPGRYRVYLIADGSSTVRVPISAASSISLQPTRPSNAHVATAANILQNPLQAANRQRLLVTGVRALTFSSISMGDFRAYAGDVEACVTPSTQANPKQACGTVSPYDGSWTGWFVSPLSNTAFSWTLEYDPGVVKPGTYDAVQDALDATTIQFATAGAFSLELK